MTSNKVLNLITYNSTVKRSFLACKVLTPICLTMRTEFLAAAIMICLVEKVTLAAGIYIVKLRGQAGKEAAR